MNPKLVERRLRLGEDSQTELKSLAHDGFKLTKELRDTLAKEIAGLANSGGGTVVEPALHCRMSKVEVEGKLLLTVEVPHWSPNRPFQAKDGFYVRDGTITRKALRDELRRVLE